MIWVSIILGLIEALPTLIQLVKDIVTMIHGHPLQAAHEHAFLGILHAWNNDKDGEAAKEALTKLHAALKSV